MPGARPVTVRYETHGTAVSPDRIEVSATPALFEAVGGRATFRGELHVSFPGARPGATVSGHREGLVLDFMPSTRERLERSLEDSQRGRSVADRLGLAFSDEEPEEGGLVVVRVTPGSVADRMGVKADDRVVAMDGLHLYTVADLLPPPGMQKTELEILRGDATTPAILQIPLFVASDAPSAFAVGMAIVLGLLLLVLLFVAPTARLSAFLARRPPFDPEATLVWLFGEELPAETRREKVRKALILGVGIVGASACFAGVAGVARFLESGFGIGILLTASLALRLTARLFGDGKDEEHEGKLLPFFVAGTPLTIAVTAMSLLVGTGHLQEVHRAQGGLPWEWLVFRNPIAFALFPVFAATALGRVEPVGTQNAVSKVAARGHLLVVSCLGAALFLGGWNAPFGSAAHAAVLGIVLYVAKCWALLGMGLWARSVSPGTAADTWRWAVPMAVLGLVATTAWLVVGVPSAVEVLSGPLLSSVALALVIYILVARVRKLEPELVLQPFL